MLNFKPDNPNSVDCEVSEYGPWSECSVTCGTGTETRNRDVTVAPLYQGAECPPLSENRTCTKDPCPGELVSCQVCNVIYEQLIVRGSGLNGATAPKPVKTAQKQDHRWFFKRLCMAEHLAPRTRQILICATRMFFAQVGCLTIMSKGVIIKKIDSTLINTIKRINFCYING